MSREQLSSHSSFPQQLLMLWQQGALKTWVPSAAPFSSPQVSFDFYGQFIVFLNPVSLHVVMEPNLQLQHKREELLPMVWRNPGEQLREIWFPWPCCWLSLPCPDKSVDSLWVSLPSNNSRTYFPLSASVGFRMWSQIWFIVLPAFSLSRLSTCFSLSKQII